MSQVVQKICVAHGGLEKWDTIERLSCKASIKGLLFDLRGQPDIFSDVDIEIECRTQKAIYRRCSDVNQYSVYEPGRVAIFEKNQLLAERSAPRTHFKGRSRDQLWDKLDAVYFGGYAIWHYACAPFLFTHPDIRVRDGEDWIEGNETWSRLHVTFPESIHSHCKEQVYYYNSAGLLQRMDYQADIVDSSIGVAHYMYDYIDIGGLKMPTRRRAFPRDSDCRHDPNLVLVDLTLNEYQVQPFPTA